MPRALIALMTLVVALSSGDQRMSPEETVRRYCALEFDGQTLTPEGRSKRAALLASAPLAPDPSGDRLVIVRDYVVKRDHVEAHAASIVADYAMFGTLDASLRFTRVEGRRPQAPTRQRRDFTLVSGGVRDRRSPDDRARAASGRMPWKIADDNTAGVAAEYIALFEMDSESANIEPGRLPPGGIKVRNDFTLILTNGPPPRALGDNVAGEAGASPVWKIDRPVPPPHITVGTAIRYVTELGDKTTDDRIRKNAVRALASLKLQK